jgi:hypothetical protein
MVVRNIKFCWSDYKSNLQALCASIRFELSSLDLNLEAMHLPIGEYTRINDRDVLHSTVMIHVIHMQLPMGGRGTSDGKMDSSLLFSFMNKWTYQKRDLTI